ncbi:PREDICTED: olfactory receptor 6M1-like [Pygoscelis adeliae]|uniref:olfactory receptor 6M1-like n=1 Tax=Pygoscelis adeliae TaxID=9238 RepID=UPI0004F50100|nr:PREDICTED: olfactory receptor 6M1-like [Pygoscelis adeliae]
MYFFLGLSFLDITYTSVTVPKLLSMLVSGNQSICFASCVLQSYFFFILGMMACDRYIAVCYTLSVVNHFCAILPLLQLACVGTYVMQKLILILSSLVILSTFLSIAMSYIYIVITILKTPSTAAFSTCVSQLAVHSSFCGAGIFMYLSPTARTSLNMTKIVPVAYSVATRMLNPMICSLRNQDMKAALRTMLIKRKLGRRGFV